MFNEKESKREERRKEEGWEGKRKERRKEGKTAKAKIEN